MKSASEIFKMLDLILPKSANIETSANYILEKVTEIYSNDFSFITIFSHNSLNLNENQIFLYNLSLNNIPNVKLGENGLISKSIISKEASMLSQNKLIHEQYIDCKTIKEEIVYPLIHLNEVFGILVLSSTKQNFFTEEDFHNLSTISKIISHILYDKIQHKALLELARPINYSNNTEEVFDLLAIKVKNIGMFPLVCVWILNKDKNEECIELKGKSGAKNNDFEAEIIFKSEGGYTWKALSQIISREASIDNPPLADFSICYDILAEDSIYLHKSFANNNQLISVISIPITYKDETYGIINAYSKNITKFNEDEKLILKNIGLSAGIEINNSILRRREEELIKLLLDQAHFTNAGMITLSLAHDVKHKLVDLKLNIGALTNSMSQNKSLKKYESIVSESKIILSTLSNLFDRLLSYNSQKGSNYKENNLKNILENINLMFSSSLDNIDFFIYCKSDIFVYCDFNQLSQVFVNLVKNSIYTLKRISHRKPFIRISVEEINNNTVQVKVFDNGEGIPESEITKIFNITYSTKGIEGSGFGLAICQNIITEILGGTIKVRSEFGLNTEFTILLKKRQKE